MSGLNVISLFDGMSCGMLALQAAGIKVQNYLAAEIDKHPMAVAKHNWGNAITHVGDVLNVMAIITSRSVHTFNKTYLQEQCHEPNQTNGQTSPKKSTST